MYDSEIHIIHTSPGLTSIPPHVLELPGNICVPRFSSSHHHHPLCLTTFSSSHLSLNLSPLTLSSGRARVGTLWGSSPWFSQCWPSQTLGWAMSPPWVCLASFPSLPPLLPFLSLSPPPL